MALRVLMHLARPQELAGMVQLRVEAEALAAVRSIASGREQAVQEVPITTPQDRQAGHQSWVAVAAVLAAEKEMRSTAQAALAAHVGIVRRQHMVRLARPVSVIPVAAAAGATQARRRQKMAATAAFRGGAVAVGEVAPTAVQRQTVVPGRAARFG